MKHPERNEIYVKTLDEVVAFVAKGFSVRMGKHGVPASLIGPESLRITYATMSN